MRHAFLALAGALAALPCLAAGASAADLAYVRPAHELTVTRVAEACPPLPTAVHRGRRGMGEPGSFVAYWEWRPTTRCNVVVGR